MSLKIPFSFLSVSTSTPEMEASSSLDCNTEGSFEPFVSSVVNVFTLPMAPASPVNEGLLFSHCVSIRGAEKEIGWKKVLLGLGAVPDTDHGQSAVQECGGWWFSDPAPC